MTHHETVGPPPPSPGRRGGDGRGGQGGEDSGSPSPVRGGGPADARERGPGGEGSRLRSWQCTRCHEDQVAFGPLPEDGLCHTCHDAQRAANAFTQADAGIPERYRRLTRQSWSAHFDRPWPEALQSWTGTPHWVALWGPTGTGKTGIATILLAEHLRTGRRGRWLSGPELSRRIQRDFSAVEEVIAPLLVTPLLVLDEPLSGSTADWYIERLTLITRTRDDRGLPTVVTSLLLPELLCNPSNTCPPPLLSRWLSGIRIHEELAGEDIRLKEAL